MPHVHRPSVALGVLLLALLPAGCVVLWPHGLGGLLPTATATEATATPRIAPSATGSPVPSLTPTGPPTVTPLPTACPEPSKAPTATPTPLSPTPDGQARTAVVPILMYHYVSEPPPGSDAVRHDLSVSPQQFEQQLAYLRDAGYSGISLADLVMYLTTGQPLPPKPVVLTFDDGYADNYTNAVPLLQRYHMPATFFVITSFLDQGLAGYLTWAQAAEMQAQGMDIEAHSVTHPDLTIIGAAQLQEEVQGASDAIAAHLSRPARFFCYPSGRYDARTLAALRSAGYWAAVTTAGGAVHTTSSLLELSRVRVHGGNDLNRFVELLAYYTE